MYIANISIHFIKFFAESIIAAYLLIFIIKLIALINIKKICGEYSHVLPIPSALTITPRSRAQVHPM